MRVPGEAPQAVAFKRLICPCAVRSARSAHGTESGSEELAMRGR